MGAEIKPYRISVGDNVLEGPLPPGVEAPEKPAEPKEAYDPDNPKPDWDEYDPSKVKTPKKKGDQD